MSAEKDILLVPVDFQEASAKALDAAKQLAPLLEARIVLVHVCTTPVYAYPGLAPVMMQGFNDEIFTAAKKALDELAASAGGLEAVLREGDPATELLAVIEARRPRLVVMGTHGRRGLSHLLLGSVAERVVRQSPVPVMTVRAPEPAAS